MGKTMKIKATQFNTLSSFEAEVEEIVIMAEDGRPLYEIRLVDGVLKIGAGMVAKHEGKMYQEKLIIEPKHCGSVDISRKEYHKD